MPSESFDVDVIYRKLREMHQEDVEEVLAVNGFEPTGQLDGDADWLVQLYRNGEIDADTLP